jgi:hypothetical protein
MAVRLRATVTVTVIVGDGFGLLICVVLSPLVDFVAAVGEEVEEWMRSVPVRTPSL